MAETPVILERIRAAIRSEPRFDPGRDHIDVAFDDGAATLEGEVADVAAKKLVLERTAALPEVAGIIDRLHVKPAQAMGDGEIRTLVRSALLQEPALAACAIREQDGGQLVTARDPAEPQGDITIDVRDGIVTLDGSVPSLAHKRMAGVLAWWVPGSRDVINGIGEELPDDDPDGDLTDAVRLALEKDSFVDASQIRVSAKDDVVLLLDLVPSEAEREIAEFNVWYVFGVDKV